MMAHATALDDRAPHQADAQSDLSPSLTDPGHGLKVTDTIPEYVLPVLQAVGASGDVDPATEPGLALSDEMAAALAAVEALADTRPGPQWRASQAIVAESPVLGRSSLAFPEADPSGARQRQAAVLEIAELREKNAQLQAELAVAQADLQQTRKRYQRLGQEQEELRRRQQRAENDLPVQGARQALQQLLPFLDDLAAMLQHLDERETLTQQGREGLQILQDRWHRALAGLQLVPFDCVGQPFDPAVHEAIAQLADPDQSAGTIIRQVARGYMLSGRLLRSAQVVVAREP